MYEVEFYTDKNGHSETVDWIIELDKKANNSKEHRIRLKNFMNILKP